MLNAPQLETTKLSVSQQGWLEYKNQQGYTPVLKAAVPVAHKQKNKQPVYVGFYPVLLPTLRGFFFWDSVFMCTSCLGTMPNATVIAISDYRQESSTGDFWQLSETHTFSWRETPKQDWIIQDSTVTLSVTWKGEI